MTRVRAPSRLHFGLLTVPTADTSADARLFGGVGLMVADPGVIVCVSPADKWSGCGPSADRALGFAKRFTESLLREGEAPAEPVGAPLVGALSKAGHPQGVPLPKTIDSAGASPSPQCPPSFRVEVLSCPPEHIGLGVGTQLGLAVAKAVAAELGLPHLSAVELAERVGRGARSGVGVHGFDGGGLILDAGKRNGEAVSSLHSRRYLPEEWRVVLACPRGAPRWHGDAERRAFAAPSAVDTTRLRELFEILGEAAEYATFAEALHEYNRLAGAVFAEAQGGVYSSPEVAALIARIRGLGVPAVGQSSWGPTVFAITPDADRAEWLAELLASPEMDFVTVTRPDSAGGTHLH